jgi:hypothetical protein
VQQQPSPARQLRLAMVAASLDGATKRLVRAMLGGRVRA